MRDRPQRHARRAARDLPEWIEACSPREPTALHEARLNDVCTRIRAGGARRVADLGCGEGQLVRRLLGDTRIERVVGVDVSMAALGRLERAAAAELALGRLALVHGSFTEAHRELAGVDTVAMVETIEHIEPALLSRVEHAVFRIRPRTVIVTTPNQEFNVLFGMAPGQMREPGHCFEWPRARFRAWAAGVAQRQGYALTLAGIGPADPLRGAPSQMAEFSRRASAGEVLPEAAQWRHRMDLTPREKDLAP